MMIQPEHFYSFDEFQLDVPKRRLLRNGNLVPLKPKAFDLLAVLVEHNGTLLTKDDLFRLVWEEQIVEESNLTVSMSAIRRALGEQAKNPRYITTVSGRGYYFNADLQDKNDEDLIIESHKISKITVEEEIETNEISEIKKLPESSISNVFRKVHPIFYGSVLVILLFGGFFFLNRENPNSNSIFSFRRLTTNGKAIKTAISSDQKMFAFSQEENDGKQSLWLGQIDGSNSFQILPPTLQTIATITFSPDNKYIYFSLYESDSSPFGTLYRMKVFGGVTEKIKENIWGQISFSPDGKQFIFVRNDDSSNESSLIIADTNGENEQKILSRPLNLKFSAWDLSWSPDGKQIAVGALINEKSKDIQILTVDLADNSAKQLTNYEWVSISNLKWQKDSKGLVAIAVEKNADLERQIWQISFPEGKVKKLISDLNLYSSLDLSGDEMLVTQGQYFSNIWIAPADNLTSAKQITFDMLGKQTGWNGVAWAGNEHIVYTSAVGSSETIWIMNPDGSNQKQLVLEGRINNNVSLPKDGSFVVFASNRSGKNEIWRINSDGNDLKQLTTIGENSYPNVSPDGKFIVYSSLQNNVDSLWKISADGGEPVRLTEKTLAFSAVSPDGKMIVGGYGKGKIALISSESGEPLKTFDAPLTSNFRLGFHWTPDGNFITYRDWKNGIWKQSINGGEPKRIENLPNEKLYGYGWSADGKTLAFSRGTVIRDVVLIKNTN